ncbi:hypothetical protein HOP50_06g43200 [Chloropicon primus]|uniref:Uncharacterized protein n=3 Tax=Chloropicon primus TaxID=1764295 RepID=A0A5B8MMB4_9CHLO|nr:hypothetical protein A3770_06p42960 [Chloropicon primus]UPR00999.1 hypothetical protein HOP50_06g43200 [Chloropicon primus]|eukprot:QDZ21778.1 hypothetical protein A3770_06p42960 [Chloropicon primus]
MAAAGASPPPSGDILAQAITAVLHTAAPQDAAAAHSWLTRFAETKEAWQTSLDLLGPQHQSNEVQFFVANLLYKKVRANFKATDFDSEEERQGVLLAINAKLQMILSTNTVSSSPSSSSLVVDRLALARALGAVQSSSPDPVVSDAISWISAGSGNGTTDKVAFTMLLTLAEEANNLEAARRQPFAQMLVARVGELFKCLDHAVQGHPHRMMACFQHMGPSLVEWIKVTAGQPGGLGLGLIVGTYGNLFNFLLNAIVSDNSIGAGEAIAAMIENSPPSDQQLYPQLIRYLLVENGSKVIGSDEGIEATTCIASAIATNHGSFFQWQEGLQLADFLLRALDRGGSRCGKEKILEFFIDLNSVPAYERLPQLRNELYESLLTRLILQVASYPPDFQGWDSCFDDDEDSFHRFREQFLVDLFEITYELIGLSYFRCIMSLFERFKDKTAAGGSWQTAEAVMYALRIVSVQVKSRLNSKSHQTQADMADTADVHQMLVIVFTHVTSGVAQVGAEDIFLSNAVLVESVARLIGSYGQWFSKNPQSPIEQCLSYLIRGTGGSKGGGTGARPSSHASHAFKVLCIKCGFRLKSRETVLGLIGATSERMNSPAVSLPDKKALVEGVSRLINLLKVEDAYFAAEQLLHPVLSHLSNEFIASTGGQGVFDLKDGLEIYASAIIFFEFPSLRPGAVHPTLYILQKSWEMFQAMLENEEATKLEDNAEAFCSIFRNVIQSAKTAAIDVVPAILSRTLHLLRLHAHSTCLEVVASAVEVFGSDDRVKQHLGEVVHQSLSVSFAFLQTVKIGENAEHVQAIYDVASRCLIFRPEIVLSPQVLEILVQMGSSNVKLRERESFTAVNAFLSQLFNLLGAQRTPAWAAAKPAAMDCLARNGGGLLVNMLDAFRETCPAHMFRSLGSCIYHFKNVLGPVFDQVFLEAVKRHVALCNGAGKQGLAFQEQDAACFVRAVLKQPPLPRPKFEAIFSDFAKVSRRELNSDALRMYE